MECVNVISDTKQEFMGEVYYRCGYYFQRKGKRLHRAVWEAYNGDIPEGYHVHHMDGDRSNNQIENLALVPGIEHIANHAREESRRENGRKAIAIAVQIAPEWHRSEEGRKWHSEHVKQYWDNAPMQTYVCDFCGKEYQTRCVRYSGHHFCGPNCKMKYRRRRLAGVYES